MVIKVRKIEGRLFKFHKWHYGAVEAQKSAKKLREIGYNARVVYVNRTRQTPQKWGVYYSRKQR